MRYKILHILTLLENIIIVLIAGLVPVYFALILPTDDVFELNKLVLFRVLLLVWLLVAVCKAFLGKRSGKQPVADVQAFFAQYLFLPFLLLVAFLAATALAVDPEVAFFGIHTKYEGLLSLLYYLAFFFLVIYAFQTRQRLHLALKSVVGASCAVCGYGLAQAFGLDPLGWIESTELRITSTFGQPNLLAAYLLLVIPLTVYYLGQSRRLWQIALGVVLAAQVLTLVFTYSMSGWIGLAAGSFVFVFVLYQAASRQQGRPVLARFSLSKTKLVLVVLFLAMLGLGLAQKTNLERVAVNRVSGLLDWQAGSPSARLDFWSAGVKAIAQRPFLGFGPDLQREAISRYYEPGWAVHSNVNVRPFRAHNIVLDVLLAAGLAGLLAYAAVVWQFFRLAWDNIRQNRDAFLNIALIWSMTGYLVYLMFNFQFVVGHIYFWLLLGLVVGMHAGTIRKPDQALAEETGAQLPLWHKSTKRRLARLAAGLVMLILLSGGAVYLINMEWSKVMADHYYRQIKTAQVLENDLFRTYELYDYLRQEPARSDYYDREYGQMLADWLPRIEEHSLTFRPTAEKRLQSIIAENQHPQTFADYLALAEMHRTLADRDSSRDFVLSRQYFSQALERSPEMPLTYRLFARLYGKIGATEKGEYYFDQALQKLPAADNPHLNSKHSSLVRREQYFVYLDKGKMYAQAGKNSLAREHFRQALGIMRTDHAYAQLAKLYRASKPQTAIKYYKQAQDRSPGYHLWPYEIAMLYADLGRTDKALEYAVEAQSLKPSSLQIKSLVKNLRGQ